MKSHVWLTAALLGSLFLFSCQRKNQVQVVSKNFESEIQQQQNLSFSFNKDLYPDSALQRWDSTAYIEFTPKVKGLFKWKSSSELEFSPAEGFEPATEYTAHLSSQLVKKSRKKYPISNEAILFHTAPLKVINSSLSWTQGKAMANTMVQLDLWFNYDVSPAEAATHIRLNSGHGNIITSTVNQGKGKLVTLQFEPWSRADEELPLKIAISKGVRFADGKHSSVQDMDINVAIPSPYTLSITGVTTQHTGLEGGITVTTSQPLQEENLKDMITVEPAVPFEVSTTDAGFVLSSKDLKAEQTYELTISSNLQGTFGGRMKTDYSEQVTFGKLDPSISFANTKGIYLSSRGYKNIALNIVNVPKVQVTVIKVYENNLEHFLRKDKSWDYSYDEEDDEGGRTSYYETEEVGDTVFRKDYETAKLPRLNSARVLHLDFEDKIKGYDGVYVVSVASREHNWVQESRVLSISDIGMIVKQEKGRIYLFANSIKNATPLDNVKVSFISTNNQRLFTAQTDADGVAVFDDIGKRAPGFKVGLITAKMADELSFVWLAQAGVETSRFDVGGRMPNAAGLNAMLYAERNLYRPGEELHVSAIVRDEQWNNPGEIPVKLRLTMPNGKEFATRRKILNEEGSTETSFLMPPTALTGTYTLEAYTGNDILLNSYNISVEEFMPDRLKSELKIDKKEYQIGDSVNAGIQADNLFGTPAADRKFEAELNINKLAFETDKHPEYDFAVQNDFNFAPQMRSGVTDAHGAGRATWSLTPDMQNVGMLKGNIMATVFDETGRPVHRYQQFTVYTQPVFVGLRQSETYVSTGVPMKIGLIAVNKNGDAQNNIPVQISVIKKEWHTVIQEDEGHFRYVSKEEERVVKSEVVAISGAGSYFPFTPQLSGEYELRAAVKGSNSYISKTFYAWGYGNTQYSSFEVNNEGNVDIKMDKERYSVGDNMNILFTTPFEGRMLVTVERDKIIKHFYLETQGKSASVKLSAEDICVPNVYITATLFRPMDGSDMPLTVAHGFRSIPVENPGYHLPVSVSMKAASRSRTKQTITVKTTPGAYVTVAAVDEGILQVKNYATPDPYIYFYQKTALSTNSYDIYPWLMPEIRLTRSSTGGDGADQSQLRVNPTFVNRVKLVSFWSGILQADGRGVVKYDIDIPQFSGDIRVMAAAYKGRGFGGADQHMKVADPVVISAALPRFLSPKDEVIMPVTMSNTTSKDISVAIVVQTTGPLSVKGAASQSITIPANREQRAVFHILAGEAIGAGNVKVTVKGGGESFINETDIGIRPPASLQKLTGSGTAEDGKTIAVLSQGSFIPSTLRDKLIIGRSPLVEFSRNLRELVEYPYGCVEQTTSTAFPQLYYADLVQCVTGKGSSDANPAYNVQQAILKLQSMQLSNGALSYWPDGGSESWWGSVYATHFLLEARKAGYEVNAKTLERLLAYLKARLNKKETEIFYYNQNLRKEIAAKEIAYSLYVLATAGDPQKATMNYYKAHPEMLSLDSRYLLAAAYTLSGQPAQARQVLPPAFSGEKASQSFGGSFYSYIRDEAVALNALLDVDPNDPQVGVMARQLSQQMKSERYLNTQENVFGILALGKIARVANKTTATAAVLVNGRQVATSNGATISADLTPYAGQPVQLQVKGKGRYYYFRETSGITSDGSYKQEDSYLKVRRSYYERNGRLISDNSFVQNDLVVVKITLESQYDGTVENVAITDMLPAGFEIENTRLSDMPEIKWIKDETTPDYMDIRDDRLNFFTSATKEPKNFYYMVRAVSPGGYQLGPVQADAMYNGMYHSYNGAGVVNVKEH